MGILRTALVGTFVATPLLIGACGGGTETSDANALGMEGHQTASALTMQTQESAQANQVGVHAQPLDEPSNDSSSADLDNANLEDVELYRDDDRWGHDRRCYWTWCPHGHSGRWGHGRHGGYWTQCCRGGHGGYHDGRHDDCCDRGHW